MKKILVFGSILVLNSAHAQLEIDHLNSNELVAPSQIVEIKGKTLVDRCKLYIKLGPPSHMKDYAPESITEIIISYGAQEQELTNELREIGGLILLESDDYEEIEDLEIRKYMMSGAQLVQEVLER